MTQLLTTATASAPKHFACPFLGGLPETWDQSFDDMDSENWEDHYTSREREEWNELPHDDEPPEDLWSDAFDPTDF